MNKRTLSKRFSALTIVVSMLLTMFSGYGFVFAADTYSVTAEGTYCQTVARSMLSQVNEFRTGSDAWYWNSDDSTKTDLTGQLSEYTYDYDLEEIAMARAIEIALSFSHTRPDGTSCSTLKASSGTSLSGENIAVNGTGTAESFFTQWAEADKTYSGQGHRRSMLSSSFTSIGIGIVKIGKYYFGVQEFGYSNSGASETTVNDGSFTQTVTADPSIFTVSMAASQSSYTLYSVGENVAVPTITTQIYTPTSSGYVFAKFTVNPTITWTSSDEAVAKVENGNIVTTGYGNATLTATISEPSTQTCEITISVVDKDLSYATMSFDTLYYQGEKQTPTATVVFNGTTLTENVDYKLSYDGDFIDAGKYTVTATGIGDYSGTLSATCTISPITFSYIKSNYSYSYKVSNVTYTGAEADPEVTFTWTNANGNTVTAVRETDFTTFIAESYSSTKEVDITNVGTVYWVWLKFMGSNYSASSSPATSFRITQADLANATIELSETSYEYDGTAKEPEVTVKLGDVTLPAADYTVAYSDNTNIGTAKVTITAGTSGNTKGTNTATFEISKIKIDSSKLDVSLASDSYTYTGSSIEPSVTVKYDGTTLTKDTDYTVTYSDNTDVGTGKATITFTGDYTGDSVEKEFTISQASVSGATVSGLSSCEYTGEAVNPDGITVTLNGKTLTSGTDYELSYSNNINVGSATVTVTGKGNYTGTKTATFKVTAASISKATVTASDCEYTGSALEPSVTVVLGEKTLTLGTDYTVAYSNNTNKGTATVTVTGMGNYTDSASGTFTIAAAVISSATVTMDNSFAYTGSAIEPEITVTLGNKTLTKDTDYEVAYTDNTNAGTATATITGINSYAGEIVKTFEITPLSIEDTTITTTAIGVQFYTGEAVTPNFTIVVSGKELVNGTDYTYTTTGDLTNAGKFYINVTAQGNYTGSLTLDSDIFPVPMESEDVKIADITEKITYTGEECEPALTITFNDQTLVAGTDYTVEYSSNIDAGTATAKITGKGNFDSDTFKEINFRIDPAPLTVKADDAKITYGDDVPNFTASATGLVVNQTLDNYTAVLSKSVTGVGEYSISVSDAKIVDANKNDVTSNYTISYETGTLTVGEMSIAKATVTPDETGVTYTGSVLKPDVTVTLDGKTLTSGTDYTVVYSNNINAGTATITITGKGNYTDTATGSFTITAASISDTSVKLTPSTYTYTGSAIEPEIKITFNGNELTEGTDYTVTFTDNTDIGRATATITGKGNFTGSTTVNFEIVEKNLGEGSIDAIADQTYTGAAIEPSLVVKHGDDTLVLGTDYKVEFSNNVNVSSTDSKVSVTVTGIGAYSGTLNAEFAITAAPLTVKANDASMTYGDDEPEYTAEATGILTGHTFTYEASVSETDLAVGTYDIAVSTVKIVDGEDNDVTSNYSVTFEKGTLTVSAASLSEAKVTTSDCTYTGAAVTPETLTVALGDVTLSSSDYTVSYSNNTDAGTATVTITGSGNYTGTAMGEFTISPASIEKATVTVTPSIASFTGSEIKPESVVVTLDGTTLTAETDYTVAYSNNTEKGTATVTVTGIGNYDGTATGTFEISDKISIDDVDISAIADQTYTGSAITPALTVKNGETALVEGTDYTATYSNNTNVGTATVKVTGSGNYTGTVSATFKITALSISSATVSLSQTSYTYSGSACKPTATVKVNGNTLTLGTDYTVAYSSNTNAGTATVTITGKGNYTGIVKKTFTISKASLSSVTCASSSVYTGSAIKPTLTVKSGNTTVSSSNYTATYSNNTNVGTATVKVTGSGNYTGTVSTTFKITARSVASGTVTLSPSSYTYSGSACTPTATVKVNGKTLTSGTDYTVSYSSNTNAGTATVKITGKGNYTGTKSVTFKIAAKSISSATVTLSATTFAYTGSEIKPGVKVVLNNKTLTGGTDYTVTVKNNKNAGTATMTITGKGNYTGTVTKTFKIVKASVSYRTHVQNYGWQAWKKDGATAGTTGEGLRLEAINIKLSGVSGGISYKTHVQVYGWQGWKSNGALSGTSGEAKRLEAIQIKLTGDAANLYDVYYRVHAQNFGWLDWAKNGESAGTAGYAFRLESIQIKLVPKGGAAPGSTDTPFEQAMVRYQTHVQNVGWQSLVGDGFTSGTSGKSLRLEGIKINLNKQPYSGSITYRTSVQNIGWMGWQSNGAMSGTSGRSLRLEAIQIKLTGEMAKHYDVYYRVHAQNYGWLDWAKNGQTSGTTGYGYRLEAIQIKILPKGTIESGMKTSVTYHSK